MKRKNPAKFERCVRAVKKRGGAKNAYAVCAKTRKNGTRRNGSEYEAAAEMSEEFHGTPAQEEFEIVTEKYEHDTLADCGELVKLEIIPINGGSVINLTKFEGARLAMSPKGFPPQLYIEGGDQAVDLGEFEIETPHEFEVLGHLKYITYYTIKHHLGRDGGEANYRHKFNDGPQKRISTKAKNRPTVIYDVNNESLMLAGGEYEILPEGIDN